MGEREPAQSCEAARARAGELNRALPDGADHRWIARDPGDGRWEVMSIRAAGMSFPTDPGELRPGRGEEREPAQDPRPFIQRLIPPYGPN